MKPALVIHGCWRRVGGMLPTVGIGECKNTLSSGSRLALSGETETNTAFRREVLSQTMRSLVISLKTALFAILLAHLSWRESATFLQQCS